MNIKIEGTRFNTNNLYYTRLAYGTIHAMPVVLYMSCQDAIQKARLVATQREQAPSVVNYTHRVLLSAFFFTKLDE